MYDKYFDWAATAPPDPDIIEMMNATALKTFGNPSSRHLYGKAARSVIETAREQCARHLGCRTCDLCFTSGGTESNNLIILSFLTEGRKGHIVMSAIEHPSVYGPIEVLRRSGFTLTVVPPDSGGHIDPQRLASAVGPDTVFVSVMTVNNETGAVQPIPEISRMIRLKAAAVGAKVHIHTDAVQALGKIPVNLEAFDVDSASFSGHKFGGPRGSGLLFCKRRPSPLFTGGGQEGGFRSGTENTAGIAGFAAALEKRISSLSSIRERLQRIEERIFAQLQTFSQAKIIPDNRSPASAGDDPFDGRSYSPHIITVAVPPVPGEVMVRSLSDSGYALSTGSACSSRKAGENRTLSAMQLPAVDAASAVRLSFGLNSTESAAAELIEEITEKYRFLNGEYI